MQRTPWEAYEEYLLHLKRGMGRRRQGGRRPRAANPDPGYVYLQALDDTDTYQQVLGRNDNGTYIRLQGLKDE